MKDIAQIRNQLVAGNFEFSRHAFRRAVERDIGENEIREAGSHAEIIEEYLEDKYSPSALLLGFAKNGRPLHFQVLLSEGELVKIITLYEPETSRWVGFRKRR